MVRCCRSEEKLRAARAALGQAAVHMIRINSLKGDPEAVLGYDRIWRLPLPGCLPSGGAGEPPSRPAIPAAVLTHPHAAPHHPLQRHDHGMRHLAKALHLGSCIAIEALLSLCCPS